MDKTLEERVEALEAQQKSHPPKMREYWLPLFLGAMAGGTLGHMLSFMIDFLS